MPDDKAVITLVLDIRLLAGIDAEAKREKRSRNNYIHLLLEQRHDHWASGAQQKDKK